MRFAVPPQDRGARRGRPGGLGNPDPPYQPPRPFDDVAVGPAEQRALRQIALEEGSWPQVIEDPMQRRTRQRLAARAHREQLADAGLRRRARPLDEHQP